MKPTIFTQRATSKSNGISRWLSYFVTAFLFFSATAASAQDVLVGLTSNGGPEGKGTAYSIKTDTKAFSVMKGFANWGENPVSDLVRASDGQLYGMTPFGGTYGYGTLFRISTSGDIMILKNFTGNVDGGYPKGSLIQAKDGYLYGMTTTGTFSDGTTSAGTIFKISPVNGQYTVLKSLSMNTDGGRPSGHLVQAADGNFYGITRAGGNSGAGYGTIFKLTTGGTYTVLKVLNGTTDGGSCYGSLVKGSDGAFYGMANTGGTYKYGVIFRYSTTQGYKVLKHLNGAVDAANPLGDLIQAKDGYLYGLAPSGIGYNGVAFKIKPDGTSFSLIHQFNVSVEGGNPYGSLVQASDGSFYGMVAAVSGYAFGVFKMSSSGSTSSVKKFTATTDGDDPTGSLIQLSDGYLYGMTQYGGKFAKGTIFKVSTGGTYSVLAHMNGASQGNQPQDNFALGKDSAYYGVTYTGGTYNFGTIFKICGGVTTVLKSFNKNVDGGNPSGGLVRGKDGNLYGTTEGGGTNGGGTIFRITPSGSFTVLRHLKSTTDGESPRGTLALATGTDSSLYGITYDGGTTGSGTVFKITQKGAFTVLHQLTYSTEGDHCESGLVYLNGAFYGMTSNNTHFFKITTAGQFAVIKALNYSTDGGYPMGNMIVGTDGSLYGTLSAGGTYGWGVIFKITTGGSLTKLRHLNGTTDGGYPKGGLVQGSDGYFYGTTSRRGTNDIGTIFKINSTGSTFSVLRNFNMATDGGTPLGGLIRAPKLGNLVATAQSVSTTEDVAKAITLSGAGGSALTYNIAIKPRNGSVTTGTGAARTYTPNANFNGVDSFAFTANIGCLASVPAWVKITVTSVNDAPVLTTIGNKSVVKGATLTFTATATDVDLGQTKTFSLITAPSGATINATSGAFSWTPTATGSFTFKVRVTDNGSPVLYDEETITITVTAPALVNPTVTTMATTRAENKSTDVTPVVKARLYPNPVVSSFTINLTQAEKDVKLTIVDVKGATVYSKQYNGYAQQLQVAAAQLQPGSYVVLLQTAGTTQTLKFIKQ